MNVNKKPKFKIGDNVKGIGINSHMNGVVIKLSHSEDDMWAVYCKPQYRVLLLLSDDRGESGWFHEKCFILDENIE